MPLTDEIKQAAEALGKQLSADAKVREYVRLAEQVQQDHEVTALQSRYDQVYQELLKRQRNGEALVPADMDEYYRLKRQLQDNPLLTAQDSQLLLVKALFAQTAQILTDELLIDYPTFAA